MKIDFIQINNLRNHSSSQVELKTGINVIHGLNGSGKTTILEAVSICGLSKSFLDSPDSSLIKYGEGFYQASASAINDLDMNYCVTVKYEPRIRKSISNSIGESLLPKDIIGIMPVVALSPDHKAITFGSPEVRRSFIDGILCQTSKVYLEELMKFKKLLKQRNNLLSQVKQEISVDRAALESWTELFIDSASEIIFRRQKFIDAFQPYFHEFYTCISEGKESVALYYSPDSIDEPLPDSFSKEAVRFTLLKAYRSKASIEEIRGLTLFGPQKDELVIKIGEGKARENASQGQHKSILISLKFAEFHYIKDKSNETPIVLLDDIFSELDERRAEMTLELLSRHNAQILLTTADVKHLVNSLPVGDNSFIFVENGIIITEK